MERWGYWGSVVNFVFITSIIFCIMWHSQLMTFLLQKKYYLCCIRIANLYHFFSHFTGPKGWFHKQLNWRWFQRLVGNVIFEADKRCVTKYADPKYTPGANLLCVSLLYWCGTKYIEETTNTKGLLYWNGWPS